MEGTENNGGRMEGTENETKVSAKKWCVSERFASKMLKQSNLTTLQEKTNSMSYFTPHALINLFSNGLQEFLFSSIRLYENWKMVLVIHSDINIKELK